MPHTHHGAFQPFWVSAVLILALWVYVRGWVRIRRIDPDTIEGWRGGSFLFGVFFIWLAMASPIAALDHELLTVHMVQHSLLLTLAPPLIWLSAPMKPLRYGLPQRIADGISRRFRSPALQGLGRAITQPAFCWLAAAATLIGWHIPSLFALGMRSEAWHGIEQASFLATGLLFWWPVVQPWPSVAQRSEWPIPLYLFLATLPCDILSGFLVFCDRVVYPMYFSSPHALGFSALEDQQCAGALMWTCVTVIYLIAGTIFAARLLSPESLRQHSFVKSGSQRSTAPHTTPQSMEVA
jgi:putative membrane protein